MNLRGHGTMGPRKLREPDAGAVFEEAARLGPKLLDWIEAYS